MSDLSNATRRDIGWGNWLLTAAALLALIDAIVQYVWTGNGIHGTEGVMLVIISSALILIAALLFDFHVLRPRWLQVVFDVLLFLGVLGTGVAAYFLEDYILLALMVIAFIGWLGHLMRPAAGRRPAVAGATS